MPTREAMIYLNGNVIVHDWSNYTSRTSLPIKSNTASAITSNDLNKNAAKSNNDLNFTQ